VFRYSPSGTPTPIRIVSPIRIWRVRPWHIIHLLVPNHLLLLSHLLCAEISPLAVDIGRPIWGKQGTLRSLRIPAFDSLAAGFDAGFKDTFDVMGTLSRLDGKRELGLELLAGCLLSGCLPCFLCSIWESQALDRRVSMGMTLFLDERTSDSLVFCFGTASSSFDSAILGSINASRRPLIYTQAQTLVASPLEITIMQKLAPLSRSSTPNRDWEGLSWLPTALLVLRFKSCTIYRSCREIGTASYKGARNVESNVSSGSVARGRGKQSCWHHTVVSDR